MSSVHLAACPNPWCAGHQVIPAALTLKRSGWRVICGCGVGTFRCETEAEAITAWNTRATPARLPDREAIEMAIDSAVESTEWQMSNFMPAVGESGKTCEARRLRSAVIDAVCDAIDP